LRIPPGVLNDGCCTDHEQPSKVAISCLEMPCARTFRNAVRESPRNLCRPPTSLLTVALRLWRLTRHPAWRVFF
jgi:hypothetical protein